MGSGIVSKMHPRTPTEYTNGINDWYQHQSITNKSLTLQCSRRLWLGRIYPREARDWNDWLRQKGQQISSDVPDRFGIRNQASTAHTHIDCLTHFVQNVRRHCRAGSRVFAFHGKRCMCVATPWRVKETFNVLTLSNALLRNESTHHQLTSLLWPTLQADVARPERPAKSAMQNTRPILKPATVCKKYITVAVFQVPRLCRWY